MLRDLTEERLAYAVYRRNLRNAYPHYLNPVITFKSFGSEFTAAVLSLALL